MLITVKTCQWLPVALGVLSLTELTRLEGSVPFSALLTHLLGTLSAFYRPYMRASIWLLLRPELPPMVCTGVSSTGKASRPPPLLRSFFLPFSVSPPSHSPVFTSQLSLVALNLVVIFGYFKSFSVTIVYEDRNSVFTMVSY